MFTLSSTSMLRRRPVLLAVAAATATVAVPLHLSRAFAMQSAGLTRKQQRSFVHNKDQLLTPVEVPLEVQEPEPEPREALPERRVPYTMNIIAQFHSETNPNMKYIKNKLEHALQSTEDLIRHVEVRLQYLEHFHREKHGHSRKRAAPDVDMYDPQTGTSEDTATDHFREALAPFQITVKVDLKNHKQVIFSNAEKHAQPTLTEALDHTADVIRKLMREEKDKHIRLWRRRHTEQKQSRVGGIELPEDEVLDREAEEALPDDEVLEWEAEEAAADAQMDRFYRTVEARVVKEDAELAGQALGKAAHGSSDEDFNHAVAFALAAAAAAAVATIAVHWVWP